MIALRPDPRQNQLLAALPDALWQRWQPRLEWVDMPLGRVLYEPGDDQSHVWFPISGIVSVLRLTQDGKSDEVAVVGREGMLGVAQVLGGGAGLGRAVVHGAGEGFRLRSGTIKVDFEQDFALRQLLLRNTQALIAQIAQTAVCNRHHSLDQQLCRWLLLRLDRLQGGELVMTQELIAQMLGVRRESVTESAHKLQQAGLISHLRGHISVLDRAGLERRSCECYAVVRREYERLRPARRQGHGVFAPEDVWGLAAA